MLILVVLYLLEKLRVQYIVMVLERLKFYQVCLLLLKMIFHQQSHGQLNQPQQQIVLVIPLLEQVRFKQLSGQYQQKLSV